MTIEQEFYKCFGIEPICPNGCTILGLTRNCDECEYADYPPITDRILLELICILNSICGVNCTAYEAKNIEDLKEEILVECLSLQDEQNLHYEVQQLFKEYE